MSGKEREKEGRRKTHIKRLHLPLGVAKREKGRETKGVTEGVSVTVSRAKKGSAPKNSGLRELFFHRHLSTVLYVSEWVWVSG